MKARRTTIVALVILLTGAVACEAANHYALAFWRNWSGQENGQNSPVDPGNAFMRIFVFDESGQPVKGVRVWFRGFYYGQWQTLWQLTDDRGHVEQGFEFSGSPCSIWCTDHSDTYTSTTDATPEFYDHDNHRSYEMAFMMKTAPGNPGTFDTRWWPNNVPADLLNINYCPSTYSLTMNTPNPLDYYSGNRSLAGSAKSSFGQTFVANADRAVMMRAHLTKGFMTYWRYAAQLFEGGPDGPPMGPKLNLRHEYISDDIKYFSGYGVDECSMQSGSTYYVKFTAADGTIFNAYECTNNVYPSGDLYENDVSVPGKDLQCYIDAMSSGNTNVGTVTGTVTDGGGPPIKEAHIVLNPGGKRLLTGNLGTYKCYNIAPGTYSMTASAPGFQDLTLNNRVVTQGGLLTTDFALQKDAGPLQIQTTTGGNIEPGAVGVAVSASVANTEGGDCFVNSAGLTFWKGASDYSGYFTVTPSGGNPTVIRGNDTEAFDFTVDVSGLTPPGDYTVQGTVDADVNLQANGSFEVDSFIPNYTGPTGWDWHSDDPPSVARVSYEHQVCYEMNATMPGNTDYIRITWIGKWSDTGSDKKQGLRVYMPNPGGTTWRTQLNIRCGSHYMEVGNYGTGDATYSFTPNKYYQIDAWYRTSDGVSQFTITPLEEPGKPVGTINGNAVASTSTSLNVKWGKMSDSGSEEMSCREFHYWFEDDSSVIMEHHWLATAGLLPTENGWGMDSGDPEDEAMLPGAPWSADSHFNITTSDKKEGAQAVQVFCSPSGGGDANNIFMSTGSDVLLPYMAVDPCTTYQVSFWYKQEHYMPSPAYLRVFWEEYDSLGNRYYYEPDAGVGYRPPFHWNKREEVSHGEWRYVSYSLTTSSSAVEAEIKLRMDKASSDPVADIVWFDDFRLLELNSYADLDADTPGTIKVAVDVSSVADAKNQPDGTLVKLTGIAVTGYPVDNTTIFYVEDDSRASGIAVDKTNGTGAELNNIVEDDRVTFTGILATVNGERILTEINVTSRTPDSAPEPVGMTNGSLGGAADGYTPGVENGVGTNNVGLLVRVWGSINNAGAGYFYVDDGSGVTDGIGSGVKIISGSIPQPGATHASVAGFSSVEESGGLYYRVIRPRGASDVVWY